LEITLHDEPEKTEERSKSNKPPEARPPFLAFRSDTETGKIKEVGRELNKFDRFRGEK
jgi:hypothetical protein